MQKLKPRDKLRIIRDGIEYEFEVAEEGGYIASVPELPGCVSHGDTFEQALEMIQHAAEGWLRVAVQHGDPFPQKFRSLIKSADQTADG